MIAAIYARKSTDQHGIAADQKSVARQIEHARQYAHRKGWTVDDACIFVDDGISGAEFSTRPGFVRLMNALKPAPTFTALVMSEESRLGREAIETAYALKQLVQSGVHVWFYLEDRERTFESPTDKLLMSVAAFADEMEREKARQRTYDAMRRKAQAGHVTGGRTFGYDNVCSACGRSILVGKARCCKEGHTEKRINEAQAEVVRRIFQLSASGAGLTRITKTLNEEQVLAPRPQRGRPAGWVNSSVREVLLRPLYRGEIVWNQTRKRDTWGQSNRSGRPIEEWIRVSVENLQIVEDDLWDAAHARFAERQAKHTTAPQRRDIESAYLLSGFARCGCCGGGLAAHSRNHGGRRQQFYGCTSFWKRGAKVCSNNFVAHMEVLDEEVIATLQDDVCRPAVIEETIRVALAELSPARTDEHRATLQADCDAARAECGRLAAAIAHGGPLPTLLTHLRAAEARVEHAEGQLQQISAPHSHDINLAGVERRLRAKLADWRGLLRRNVAEGRAVLRALLVEPLRFTPVVDGERRGYAFEGTIALDRLVAGVVDLPTKLASPTGTGRLWYWPVDRLVQLVA